MDVKRFVGVVLVLVLFSLVLAGCNFDSKDAVAGDAVAGDAVRIGANACSDASTSGCFEKPYYYAYDFNPYTNEWHNFLGPFEGYTNVNSDGNHYWCPLNESTKIKEVNIHFSDISASERRLCLGGKLHPDCADPDLEFYYAWKPVKSADNSAWERLSGPFSGCTTLDVDKSANGEAPEWCTTKEGVVKTYLYEGGGTQKEDWDWCGSN